MEILNLNNVKINRKTKLTSLVETFWAIETSITASGFLQTHSQAVALANGTTKTSQETNPPIIIYMERCQQGLQLRALMTIKSLSLYKEHNYESN